MLHVFCFQIKMYMWFGYKNSEHDQEMHTSKLICQKIKGHSLIALISDLYKSNIGHCFNVRMHASPAHIIIRKSHATCARSSFIILTHPLKNCFRITTQIKFVPLCSAQLQILAGF